MDTLLSAFNTHRCLCDHAVDALWDAIYELIDAPTDSTKLDARESISHAIIELKNTVCFHDKECN